MKVNSENPEVGFSPIHLNIVLESAEEARAFYAIFNYTRNTDLFKNCQDIKIRKQLQEFRQLDEDAVIANGITYQQFYYPKKD